VDNYTRDQIARAQNLQEVARELAAQERARTLARLAMEQESVRVQQAMAAKLAADRLLQDQRNRERGLRNNWR
jgi:hypothetical protein